MTAMGFCRILVFVKKTIFRVGINTAIGVALIYFWLKLVNIEEILHALESFNPIVPRHSRDIKNLSNRNYRMISSCNYSSKFIGSDSAATQRF